VHYIHQCGIDNTLLCSVVFYCVMSSRHSVAYIQYSTHSVVCVCVCVCVSVLCVFCIQDTCSSVVFYLQHTVYCLFGIRDACSCVMSSSRVLSHCVCCGIVFYLQNTPCVSVLYSRLVKIHVSFAEYRRFYRTLLQKSPTSLEYRTPYSRLVYGLATVSRLMKNIGLFCRISSLL